MVYGPDISKLIRDQMHSEDAKKNNNEELMPFLYNCLMFLRHNIIRYCIYIMSFMVNVMSIYQIYYFLKMFDIKLWIQFAPFFFVNCYMSLSLPLAIASYDTWTPRVQLLKERVFANLASASPAVKSKIAQEAKVRSFMFSVHYGVTMALMIVNLVSWVPQRSNFYLISMLTEDYLFPPLYELLHLGFYSFGALSVYPMCLAPYYSVYGLQYLKFQMDLLIGLTNSSSAKLKNRRQMTNRSYQNAVKRKLRIIVQRHQEILSFNHEVESAAKAVHIVYMISTMFILFYMIFSAFSPFYGWLQPATGFMTFYVWMIYFCRLGQHFEDASLLFLSALNDMEWYQWDNSNKKNFAIMLRLAAIPLRVVPVISDVQVNHQFFKQVVKLMYSVGNIFNSANSENKKIGK